MARSGSILLALGLVLACAETPAPPPSGPAPPPAPGFSGDRAFGHLAALAAEPRPPGSEAQGRARHYLRAQLEGLGVEVLDQSDSFRWRGEDVEVGVHNLVGVVPGASTDLVVLAAPFDSQDLGDVRFVGANDGASGAALLLELARVFAEKPLPYTIWLAFLEHEAPVDPSHDDRQGLLGSRLLVQQLRESERLGDLRVAVYFNQVADADLTITRDLRSHRRYRIAFFEAARRLGYAKQFPADAPFGQPVGGHLVFDQAGKRVAVVIADDRFGGDETPGTLSHTEEDDLAHVSAESLEIVGRTSETALRDITATLAKIDRFSRRPAPSGPPTDGVAGDDTEAGPESGTDPDADGAGASGSPEVSGSPDAPGAPDATPGEPPASAAPEAGPQEGPQASAAGGGAVLPVAAAPVLPLLPRPETADEHRN